MSAHPFGRHPAGQRPPTDPVAIAAVAAVFALLIILSLVMPVVLGVLK